MKNARCALILLLGLPLSALAADRSTDESFYKMAAEGGISEVELGQLAQEKSKSPAVREFGAMMVKDHSAANDMLKKVAMTKGIELPTGSSVTQKAAKAKLGVLTGDTFDKAYIKGMVSDHKEDIAEFSKEAQSGQDPQAKAFAAAMLPTLKAHLTKIQAIAAAAGVQTD